MKPKTPREITAGVILDCLSEMDQPDTFEAMYEYHEREKKAMEVEE